MKFELARLPRNCNKAVVLDEIRRVASLIETPHISREEFDKKSRISSSSIVKRFGSWNAGLSEAGLSERYKGLKISARMHQQKGKRMTNADLLNELRRVAGELETKFLTIEQFDKRASISAETVRRRFGSWWNALNEAGLQISNHGKRYSAEDYFENLLTVWTHHSRQPKYREMDEPPSKISSGAYEAKWGNWHNALLAFLERVNADVKPIKPEKKSIPSSRILPDTNEARRVRTIPLGLRYDVLKRDHFKCVLCGDSPALNPKCTLHIDHTTPYARDGKNEKENLRTLCANCNQGKSDKQE